MVNLASTKKPGTTKETTLNKDYTAKLDKIIQIDERQIKDHLGELVRGTVEETLNNLLDAEADQLCNAAHYPESTASNNIRLSKEK